MKNRLVVIVYLVYFGYAQCISSPGEEPCLCWSLAALETLQITCVNWDQRLCLYISIWPYSWPISQHCAAGASGATTALTVASEILPSIMGGWQTGRCGHREKGTCLLVLTTVSIQAV